MRLIIHEVRFKNAQSKAKYRNAGADGSLSLSSDFYLKVGNEIHRKRSSCWATLEQIRQLSGQISDILREKHIWAKIDLIPLFQNPPRAPWLRVKEEGPDNYLLTFSDGVTGNVTNRLTRTELIEMADALNEAVSRAGGPR